MLDYNFGNALVVRPLCEALGSTLGVKVDPTLYIKRKGPSLGSVLFKKTLKVGAYLLFRLRSTIGGSGLNFRVRNENGWTPTPKAPTLSVL